MSTDILLQPVQDPPTGIESDFENPGGSHALGYFVVIFGAVLSTAAVLLRLTASYVLRRRSVVDILLVLGLGTFGGYEWALYVTAITPGVQVHTWNYQMKDLGRYKYHLHIASICYGLTIMFLKLAILYDWLRTFIPPRQRTPMFWTIHFLSWSNVIYYVVGTLLEIIRCTPRQQVWDPFFAGGSCPSEIQANNFVSASINLASDLAILAVPQWVIWRLHMSRAKKIGVSLLFVIGIFATICGIFRLVALLRILTDRDEIYWITELGLWGVGEITAGFLIIGIPALPKIVKSLHFTEPLISIFRPWMRTSALDRPSQDSEALNPWPRPFPKKRRGLWEISELDTYGLTSINAAGGQITFQGPEHRERCLPAAMTREVLVQATSQPREYRPNLITREMRVEVANTPRTEDYGLRTM